MLRTSALITMALYAPSDDRDLPPIEDSGRIPMSFPAILRHPGLSDRHTHLYSPSSTSVPGVAKPYKKTKRNDNEGKRWVRRRDNGWYICCMSGPTAADYSISNQFSPLYGQSAHCTCNEERSGAAVKPSTSHDLPSPIAAIPSAHPKRSCSLFARYRQRQHCCGTI